jgi:hypothetical protein
MTCTVNVQNGAVSSDSLVALAPSYAKPLRVFKRNTVKTLFLLYVSLETFLPTAAHKEVELYGSHLNYKGFSRVDYIYYFRWSGTWH